MFVIQPFHVSNNLNNLTINMTDIKIISAQRKGVDTYVSKKSFFEFRSFDFQLVLHHLQLGK